MLSRADDFPIHQTPEPVAYAGTDRNFYDRYFFNGYSRDGEHFFGIALGVYPHLNIMDAGISVVRDGVQHNLHASRHLGMERLDTRVGPISLEVIEPLHKLGIRVGENEHPVRAELTFEARCRPIEEPRFQYRIGPRTIMDYTRLTQNGSWTGWIEIEDQRVDLSPAGFLGTRDRSWGIRPVGAQDSQPVAPAPPPQFFWLWAPMNYDDGISLYHDNARADGTSWNTRGVLAPTDGGEPTEYADVECELTYRPGTRRVKRAIVTYGRDARLTIEPAWCFYMAGLGYLNPEWGHGLDKGRLATGYECWNLGDIPDVDPSKLHVQAFSTASLEHDNGSTKSGVGVLEQLVVGPHAPSGFHDLLDTAP